MPTPRAKRKTRAQLNRQYKHNSRTRRTTGHAQRSRVARQAARKMGVAARRRRAKLAQKTRRRLYGPSRRAK